MRLAIDASEGLDPIETWEFVKSQVIEFCQTFSKNKAKLNNKRRLELTQMLSVLNDDLAVNTQNLEYIKEAIQNIVMDLNQIIQHKINGSIFRSRAKYYSEGEKNSKYFFGLEKCNYFSKNMRAVRMGSGRIVTEQNRILREQYRFYKELYKENVNVHFDLYPEPGEILLDEIQIEAPKKPITLEELKLSLYGMKNNKCPSLDGLPKEFYVKFFDTIGPLLLRLYEFCYEIGELNPSARRGLISLLPKKLANSLALLEWRPLTLLSLDFKILSKTLAERMKKVLPSIICDDQVGFMAGRN